MKTDTKFLLGALVLGVTGFGLSLSILGFGLSREDVIWAQFTYTGAKNVAGNATGTAGLDWKLKGLAVTGLIKDYMIAGGLEDYVSRTYDEQQALADYATTDQEHQDMIDGCETGGMLVYYVSWVATGLSICALTLGNGDWRTGRPPNPKMGKFFAASAGFLMLLARFLLWETLCVSALKPEWFVTLYGTSAGMPFYQADNVTSEQDTLMTDGSVYCLVAAACFALQALCYHLAEDRDAVLPM